MSRLTDKDKKDWKDFTEKNEPVGNKDTFIKKNQYSSNLKKLDLHGYTLEEANKKVFDFIEDCFEKGFLKLNIITGKGNRSKNKEDPFKSKDLAILKYSVPDFINNNSDLMKKINKIDFDQVNSPLSGSFNIILKKK